MKIAKVRIAGWYLETEIFNSDKKHFDVCVNLDLDYTIRDIFNAVPHLKGIKIYGFEAIDTISVFEKP